MKNKIIKTTKTIIAILTVFTLTLPLYANSVTENAALTKTDSVQNTGSEAYRIGYMNAKDEDGTDYSKVTDAFTGAYNSFEDGYSPTSDVISENGYYSQTYSNANGRNASIYVDKDNKAYSVAYPIYDSWNSVGGVTATGYPTSTAYNSNGTYYQNFTNGYIKYSDENVSFVNSKSVDKNGTEITNKSAENVKNTETDTTEINTNTNKTDNSKTSENSTLKNNGNADTNINYKTMSGVGADGSGKAGSLEASAEMNPLTTIVGLAIIAAAVIILVSFSYITDKERH